MTNEEVREHMDMLIAHKDRALETHPYLNRCNCCIHSEEQDGSNCYECVKNMTDNFEAQPTSDYDIIKALKAVRTIHNGNYAPQIDEAIRRLEASQTVTEFADKCKECGKIKEDLYEKGFEDGKRYIVDQCSENFNEDFNKLIQEFSDMDSDDFKDTCLKALIEKKEVAFELNKAYREAKKNEKKQTQDDLKGDNMEELFDNFTIEEIAESVFEYAVEEVEDWTDLCYEDLSSPSQERYLKLVKEQLELLFTEEFQRIKDKTNESEEIKRIRRENEELKRRLAMVDMDFVEDMGK